MAKEIKVALTLDTKNFNKKMKGAKSSMAGFSSQGNVAKGSIIGLAARFAPLAAGVVAVTAGFKGLNAAVGIASKFEDVNVTLKNVTGSAEAGAAAFEIIKRVAEEIPVSFDELAGSAPALATVSSNVGDLQDNMMLAADIAATFGIPFEDAAGQLQRSFSAGAGAADIFREKGVLAMAGFEAGVSYSIDETKEKLRELGESIDGAAGDLSKTLTGATSQAGDAFTLFGASIGDAIVPEFTAFLNGMVKVFRDNKADILAFGTAIGTTVVNALVAFAKGVAIAIDIIASLGQFATRIAQGIRQNFGEQIKVVASVVVQAFAGITEALATVGMGLGKLISLTTGDKTVENYFTSIEKAAENLRRNGLDAIDDTRVALGDMIPVTTARDAVNEFVSDFRAGADKIRQDTVSLVDKTEIELRRFEFNLGSAGKAVSQSFKNIGDVINELNLFESFDRVTIPLRMLEEGVVKFQDSLSFTDLESFKAELNRVNHELKNLGLEFKDLNDSAIIFELLKGKLNDTILTQKDFTTMQKLINQLFEDNTITIGEQIEMLNRLDETFADQEGMRSFLQTLGQAQVTLSESLATALLEGQSAMDSFKSFFKTMITQVIADTLRLAIIQPILGSLFGVQFGSGGSVTGMDFGGSFFGGLFGGGKAAGGPVMAGKTYLVGEKGPELLSMGSNSGNITPNNMIGGSRTTVNYNIQAVDAPSFQALVASDPEFMFSVTEAGRRKIPGVRLR